MSRASLYLAMALLGLAVQVAVFVGARAPTPRRTVLTLGARSTQTQDSARVLAT